VADAVVDLKRRDELAADPKRQLGGQGLFVGNTADTVGTEETRHRELISIIG